MLSYEDYMEMGKRHREQCEKYDIGPFKKKQQQSAEELHKNCDHPNTMENDEAMLLYIITMIGGAIFVDRLIIWVVATFIWWRHIHRHKR